MLNLVLGDYVQVNSVDIDKLETPMIENRKKSSFLRDSSPKLLCALSLSDIIKESEGTPVCLVPHKTPTGIQDICMILVGMAGPTRHRLFAHLPEAMEIVHKHLNYF